MATYAKILRDTSENQILPYTRSELVYMKDGRSLQKTYDTKADYSGNYGVVTIGENINSSNGKIWISQSCVTSALGYTPPKTNTTYDIFTGASSSSDGKSGLVPVPKAIATYSTGYHDYKFLCNNGNWERLGISHQVHRYINSPDTTKVYPPNEDSSSCYDTAAHFVGKMVYVPINFKLKKDYIAGSDAWHIITLENMPPFDNICGEYITMIHCQLSNYPYGVYISIGNITVSNGSSYRFNNGIKINLYSYVTIPAGTRIMANIIYFTNSNNV